MIVLSLHLHIDGHDGHRVALYAYNGHADKTKKPMYPLELMGDFTAWCYTCKRRIRSVEVEKHIDDADGHRVQEPENRRDR